MLAWRLKLLDSANAVSTGTAASVFRLVKEENMMRYVRARILLQVGSFVALMVLIAVETEVCSCQVVEGIVETWIGLTRKVGITGRYRHLKVCFTSSYPKLTPYSTFLALITFEQVHEDPRPLNGDAPHLQCGGTWKLHPICFLV